MSAPHPSHHQSKDEALECPDCESGRRWVSKHGGNDPDVRDVRCERCDGSGKLDAEKAA